MYQTDDIQPVDGSVEQQLRTCRQLLQRALNKKNFGAVVSLAQTVLKIVTTCRHQQVETGEAIQIPTLLRFFADDLFTIPKTILMQRGMDEDAVGVLLDAVGKQFINEVLIEYKQS